MTLSSLKPTAPRLEIRDARASSVIVHHVPAGRADAIGRPSNDTTDAAWSSGARPSRSESTRSSRAERLLDWY